MTQNYFSKMQCLRSKLLAWSKFYNKLMYKTLYFSLSFTHCKVSYSRMIQGTKFLIHYSSVCTPPHPPHTHMVIVTEPLCLNFNYHVLGLHSQFPTASYPPVLLRFTSHTWCLHDPTSFIKSLILHFPSLSPE